MYKYVFRSITQAATGESGLTYYSPLTPMDEILNRPRPSVWEQFRSSPLLFLARLFYTPLLARPKHCPHDMNIHVVCISDTHNTHRSQPPLPDGDILIHAGDLTTSGTQQELDNVLSWLNSQPHPHKFFIAGNHDTALATRTSAEIQQYISSTFPSLTYLQETSVEVTIRGRTLHIYGSPYTPQHGSWAFQYPRAHPQCYSPSTSEYQAAQIWSRIPPLIDILITHGPPLGHLDSDPNLNPGTSPAGCYALLKAIWHVRPKVHVFGHIHVGRGVESVKWDAAQKQYEEVLARRAGWRGLVNLLWYWVLTWFWRGSPKEVDATMLINAASVGGLRDDQKRGAITVDI